MKDYSQIDLYAKIIWEYMLMHHTLVKSDCIFILGSTDLRVPLYAAELYHKGYAPHIICSGGFGKGQHLFKAEALVFKDMLLQTNVPETAIIIESQSTNTGENIIFTERLLEEKGLHFTSFILVQKPYMERRTYATFKKQWQKKDVSVVVTSPQISYEEYMLNEDDKDRFINTMVGDLQRILEYPKRGFQIEQDVPEHVLEASKKLLSLGYTKWQLV